jgi:hypothetical protein
MRQESAPSYCLTIAIAGDFETAKVVCRRYCMQVGLCVTIEPVAYIYTGGEEAGVRVGLINYPRFPSTEEQIWHHATELAELLRSELCQHSYSIIGPDRTIWNSLRETA